MFWIMARDGNEDGYRLYRKHYSAKKNRDNRPVKCRLFVGPGEKMVLIGWMCEAVFAWQHATVPRLDKQEGVCCTIFRNESQHRSSDMIREAMQLAWGRWPGLRLFTMVNPAEVRSTNPGCCFKKAGWKKCGTTKGGKIILECKA